MTDTELKPWRVVWRDGFAPHMTTAELVALRDGLAADDPRLTQGTTTTPPPLLCVQDWACEAACLVAYPGAATRGGFACTLEEAKARTGPPGGPTVFPHTNPAACPLKFVEERFARLCYLADATLGEPAACRHLLIFWDDAPRGEAVREMLAEVELTLSQRSDR